MWVPTCVAGAPAKVSKKNVYVSSLQFDGNVLEIGKDIDNMFASCPWDGVLQAAECSIG